MQNEALRPERRLELRVSSLQRAWCTDSAASASPFRVFPPLLHPPLPAPRECLAGPEEGL